MNCKSYNDEIIDYELMCADCYLVRYEEHIKDAHSDFYEGI